MSDETRPEGLETKDLPRGYGHAGVPAPDTTGVMTYSAATDTVQPATTVNTPTEGDTPETGSTPEATADPATEGGGTADAGAHEGDAAPDATPSAQ